MGKPMNEPEDWEAHSMKSAIRLVCWSFAWVGTMVLADKAELYEWHSSSEISILAIAVNAVIGVGLIRTFIRYLKGLDELQRKIQLDALALSVGVGLVSSFSYSLLETAQLISDAEISDITLIIILTYVAGTIIGQVRYR